MIIKGKAKTAVRRLAASSVVQTFTADPSPGRRFCGGTGKCCSWCTNRVRSRMWFGGLTRRHRRRRWSLVHRTNGINPDKPTRINPQTKRKRVIYKIYRYTRMVYMYVYYCMYCTYACALCIICVCVCVCVFTRLNETTVAPDARGDRPSKFYHYICTRFVYNKSEERNKTATRVISFFGKPTMRIEYTIGEDYYTIL